MVKLGLLPVRIGVAAVTLLTQSARVGVILRMASITGARCVAERLIRDMAVCAIGAPMGAGQNEVGPAMIKQARVNSRYVGIPALVVRVAGDALVPLRTRESAMEAVFRTSIGADVFVATGTQCGACLI